MTYIFTTQELCEQADEVAARGVLLGYLRGLKSEVSEGGQAVVDKAIAEISSLAADLRANMQILDRIAEQGPVGVRLAVRRAQGESHPPWVGAEPVAWQRTAEGEWFDYEFSSADNLVAVVRAGLGFDSSYVITCVTRGAESVVFHVRRGKRPPVAAHSVDELDYRRVGAPP